MIKTDIIERRYWSIGRLALELKINPSKIRFWESSGLIKCIKKQHHSNPKWITRYFDSKRYKEVKLICDLRNFGIEVKLIRVALKNQYAQELLDYLKRMR